MSIAFVLFFVYGIPVLTVLPAIVANTTEVGKNRLIYSFERVRRRIDLTRTWLWLPLAAYLVGVIGNIGVSLLVEDIRKKDYLGPGANVLLAGILALQVTALIAVFALDSIDSRGRANTVAGLYAELRHLSDSGQEDRIRSNRQAYESALDSLCRKPSRSARREKAALKRVSKTDDWDWTVPQCLDFFRGIRLDWVDQYLLARSPYQRSGDSSIGS